MLTYEGIDENLRFLILEVRKQVERTREFLVERNPKLLPKMHARDDYIDNLKSIIQRKCFSLAGRVGNDKRSVELLRTVDIITTNLERIADFCENIIGQLGYIENDALLRKRDFQPFFDAVLSGIELIEPATFELDVQVALGICSMEMVLDRLYEGIFHEILVELEAGRDTQTLVTTILITRYFERMGDSLLNIGEAIISAHIGERIKIGQFWALEDTLDAAALDRGIDDIELNPVGETKSGCRINRVDDRQGGGRAVIFKEGRTQKLIEEKESIERWHALFPGLAPKVYSFNQRGEFGAILFEYLHGSTFEEFLLARDQRDLEWALDKVWAQATHIWRTTMEPEPTSARFMAQLKKRLPDVFSLHPELANRGVSIGDLVVASFEELVIRAEALEERLTCPYRVLIHGDFNVDNIIIDAETEVVHYIDLHRSRPMDYLQDVSVFIVSNFRLQVFTTPVRRRISYVVRRFYELAKQWAQETGDTHFELRLALGLARSFATSARFVLDDRFARAMFLRARYLLERALAHALEAPDTALALPFALPIDALVE